MQQIENKSEVQLNVEARSNSKSCISLKKCAVHEVAACSAGVIDLPMRVLNATRETREGRENEK